MSNFYFNDNQIVDNDSQLSDCSEIPNSQTPFFVFETNYNQFQESQKQKNTSFKAYQNKKLSDTQQFLKGFYNQPDMMSFQEQNGNQKVQQNFSQSKVFGTSQFGFSRDQQGSLFTNINYDNFNSFCFQDQFPNQQFYDGSERKNLWRSDAAPSPFVDSDFYQNYQQQTHYHDKVDAFKAQKQKEVIPEYLNFGKISSEQKQSFYKQLQNNSIIIQVDSKFQLQNQSQIITNYQNSPKILNNAEQKNYEHNNNQENCDLNVQTQKESIINDLTQISRNYQELHEDYQQKSCQIQPNTHIQPSLYLSQDLQVYNKKEIQNAIQYSTNSHEKQKKLPSFKKRNMFFNRSKYELNKNRSINNNQNQNKRTQLNKIEQKSSLIHLDSINKKQQALKNLSPNIKIEERTKQQMSVKRQNKNAFTFKIRQSMVKNTERKSRQTQNKNLLQSDVSQITSDQIRQISVQIKQKSTKPTIVNKNPTNKLSSFTTKFSQRFNLKFNKDKQKFAFKKFGFQNKNNQTNNQKTQIKHTNEQFNDGNFQQTNINDVYTKQNTQRVKLPQKVQQMFTSKQYSFQKNQSQPLQQNSSKQLIQNSRIKRKSHQNYTIKIQKARKTNNSNDLQNNSLQNSMIKQKTNFNQENNYNFSNQNKKQEQNKLNVKQNNQQMQSIRTNQQSKNKTQQKESKNKQIPRIIFSKKAPINALHRQNRFGFFIQSKNKNISKIDQPQKILKDKQNLDNQIKKTSDKKIQLYILNEKLGEHNEISLQKQIQQKERFNNNKNRNKSPTLPSIGSQKSLQLIRSIENMIANVEQLRKSVHQNRQKKNKIKRSLDSLQKQVNQTFSEQKLKRIMNWKHV